MNKIEQLRYLHNFEHFRENYLKLIIDNLTHKKDDSELKILWLGNLCMDNFLFPLLYELCENKNYKFQQIQVCVIPIFSKISYLENAEPSFLKEYYNHPEYLNFSYKEVIDYFDAPDDKGCVLSMKDTELKFTFIDKDIEKLLPYDALWESASFDLLLLPFALNNFLNWRLVSSHLLRYLKTDGMLFFIELKGTFTFLDGKLTDLDSNSDIYNFSRGLSKIRSKHYYWQPEICASNFEVLEEQLHTHFDVKEVSTSDEINVQLRRERLSDIITQGCMNYLHRGLTNHESEIDGLITQLYKDDKNEITLTKGLKYILFKKFNRKRFEVYDYWKAKQLNESIEKLPASVSDDTGQKALDIFLSHDILLPNTYLLGIMPWDVKHSRWGYPFDVICNNLKIENSTEDKVKLAFLKYILFANDLEFSLSKFFVAELNSKIPIQVEFNDEEKLVVEGTKNHRTGEIVKVIFKIPNEYKYKGYIQFPKQLDNEKVRVKNRKLRSNIFRFSLTRANVMYLFREYSLKVGNKGDSLEVEWDKFEEDKYNYEGSRKDLEDIYGVKINNFEKIVKSLYCVALMLNELPSDSCLKIIPVCLNDNENPNTGVGCMFIIEGRNTPNKKSLKRTQKILSDREVLINHTANRLLGKIGMTSSLAVKFRRKAMKAAIAAIISRNGSHGLGSNVLPMVSYGVHKSIDNKLLFRYLRQRLDYIAQAASEFPRWTYPVWFTSDLMMGFYTQFHILDKLVKAEKLSAYKYSTEDNISEFDPSHVDYQLDKSVVVYGWTRWDLNESGDSNTLKIEVKGKEKTIYVTCYFTEESKAAAVRKRLKNLSISIDDTDIEKKKSNSNTGERFRIRGVLNECENNQSEYTLKDAQFIDNKLIIKTRKRNYIDYTKGFKSNSFSTHGDSIIDVGKYDELGSKIRKKLECYIYAKIKNITTKEQKNIVIIRLADNTEITGLCSMKDHNKFKGKVGQNVIVKGYVFKEYSTTKEDKIFLKECELHDRGEKSFLEFILFFNSYKSISVYRVDDLQEKIQEIAGSGKIKVIGHLEKTNLEEFPFKISSLGGKAISLQKNPNLKNIDESKINSDFFVVEGVCIYDKQLKEFVLTDAEKIDNHLKSDIEIPEYEALISYKNSELTSSEFLVNSKKELENFITNITVYGVIKDFRFDNKENYLILLTQKGGLKCLLNENEKVIKNLREREFLSGSRVLVRGEIYESGDGDTPMLIMRDSQVVEFVEIKRIITPSLRPRTQEQLGMDIQVAVPGGVVGYQAFYCILENIIRNSAKHDWAKLREEQKIGRNLEIKIEIDDRFNRDYVVCRIWNNVSNLYSSADRDKYDESDIEDINFNNMLESFKLEDYIEYQNTRLDSGYKNKASIKDETNPPKKKSPLHHTLNYYLCDPPIDEKGVLVRDHLGISETKISAGYLNQKNIETLGSDNMKDIMLEELTEKPKGFIRTSAIWEYEKGKLIPYLGFKIKLPKPKELVIFFNLNNEDGEDKEKKDFLRSNTVTKKTLSTAGIRIYENTIGLSEVDFEICVIHENSRIKDEKLKEECFVTLLTNFFLESQDRDKYFEQIMERIEFYPYRLIFVFSSDSDLDKIFKTRNQNQIWNNIERNYLFVMKRIRFIEDSKFQMILEKTIKSDHKTRLKKEELFKLSVYNLWLEHTRGVFKDKSKICIEISLTPNNTNYSSNIYDSNIPLLSQSLDVFLKKLDMIKPQVCSNFVAFYMDNSHNINIGKKSFKALGLINTMIEFSVPHQNTSLEDFCKGWIEYTFSDEKLTEDGKPIGNKKIIEDRKEEFAHTLQRICHGFTIYIHSMVSTLPTIFKPDSNRLHQDRTSNVEYSHDRRDISFSNAEHLNKTLPNWLRHGKLRKTFEANYFNFVGTSKENKKSNRNEKEDEYSAKEGWKKIIYNRHKSTDRSKHNKNVIHAESLSGMQVFYSVLKEPPQNEYYFLKLILQLYENAFPFVMILDERVGNYLTTKYDELNTRYGNININVPHSIQKIRVEDKDTPIIEGEVILCDKHSVDDEPIKIPVNESEIHIKINKDFIHEDLKKEKNINVTTIIIHYAIIEKLFDNQKEVELFLKETKKVIPSIIITSGRGEPFNLPRTAKFLPYSNIESFLLKPYPEKFLFTQIILKALKERKRN